MARRELLYRVMERHGCAAGADIKKSYPQRIVRAVYPNRIWQLAMTLG